VVNQDVAGADALLRMGHRWRPGGWRL